jgi:hypothetical protein
MANLEKENMNLSAKSNFNDANQTGAINKNVLDSDEQFILDIIRKTKQESIQNLTDLLRMQESKSILLIRLLERYQEQLEEKF